MLNSKRGQGLSTSTIILIILGVAVLVLLIVGFTKGWGSIAPWIKTNNVDTIAQACATACSTNSVYDYCSVERELKDSERNRLEESCYTYSLDVDLKRYGVAECQIDCKPSVDCEKWELIPPGKTNIRSVKLDAEKEKVRTTNYCTP